MSAQESVWAWQLLGFVNLWQYKSWLKIWERRESIWARRLPAESTISQVYNESEHLANYLEYPPIMLPDVFLRCTVCQNAALREFLVYYITYCLGLPTTCQEYILSRIVWIACISKRKRVGIFYIELRGFSYDIVLSYVLLYLVPYGVFGHCSVDIFWPCAYSHTRPAWYCSSLHNWDPRHRNAFIWDAE